MSTELYAKAQYDFKPSHPDDLPLREGDIIKVLHQDPSGWWSGLAQNGKKGIFPYNFVQVIDPKVREIPLPPPKTGTLMADAASDRLRKIRINSLKLNGKVPELKIEIITKKDMRIEVTKSISEVRRLAEFLKSIDRPIQKKLPPQWADRADTSESANKYRMMVFQDFFRDAIGDITQEYAVAYWADQNTKLEVTEKIRERVEGKLEKAKAPQLSLEAAPILARAMYDWKQRDELELELLEDEIIAVITRRTQYDGWWMGENSFGKRGIFPFNYVQLLSPEEAEKYILGGKTDTVDGRTQALPNSERINQPKNMMKEGKIGRVTKFLIGTTEAFDSLLQKGYAMEEMNGSVARVPSSSNCPKKGDFVVVKFAAYTWNPQKQEIICFSDNQSEPLEFKIGSGSTIPGLQKAVQRMETGQQCRVIIAPEQGYGAVGNPPQIPPNAHIVYDLVLDDIRKQGGRESTFFGAGVAASAVAQRPIRSSVKFYNPNAGKEIQEDEWKPPFVSSVQPTQLQKTVDYEKNKNGFTLNKLQEIVASGELKKYGVDIRNIEEYLTDEEFEKAFEVDRITFMLMPAFRQKQLKTQNNLVPQR